MTDLTAEIFAASVVEAERLNPSYERKHIRRIAAKFHERFGQDHILTETFVGRVRNHKENWDMCAMAHKHETKNFPTKPCTG